VHYVKGAGPLALGNFYRNFFCSEKQMFLGEKAFCFKTEIKMPTFQGAEHNLNEGPDMSK